MNLPKTLKMPFMSAFEKRPQDILRKPYVVSLIFSLVFKIVFGIFLASSELSQIVKIRKLSRNTQITSSEKSSWRLKLSFWKKNCPTNSNFLQKTNTCSIFVGYPYPLSCLHNMIHCKKNF
jgi:hypothetical protein